MKKRSVQRVAAIHDLSGFGRASLTAIIPILSSMGVQVCPLPTAILSNHTGGFDTFSFVDFTDYMQDYIDGWKKLQLDFDCIYSGFLGSERQIQIVSDFIDDFGTEENMVVVDPVLGDNGKLYSTMTKDHVAKMSQLVSKADIITPNFTEVSLLLNQPYEEKITDEKIKEWLRKLSDMGPEIVVATSVPDQGEGKDSNVVAFDRRSDTFWKIQCSYIPASYPGTGDAYTSVMIGSLLDGDSLPIALDKGVQFITQAIKASYGFDYPKREGVLLERVLEVLKMPVVLGGYEMLK
ncbi:MAG TPA: pyridoxamine kinase [Candidatus Anaerostipes excrementavium]|uniref:pyridoxal kinase n=1 Tax=Candidatus Anaerostipes excrementavium TaxID=2838463 RepID=A0A9D1WXW6_9FIRM|nr:pyridoxamine kinase [uncultured Anaerostipes sp.]HIX68836.1 pyridoxamine kinase [Candidatus Anaerostipes excrementavium]